MEFEKLKEEIKNEWERCGIEIKRIDIEMARLQGKREEIEDRKTMLWGFLNQQIK